MNKNRGEICRVVVVRHVDLDFQQLVFHRFVETRSAFDASQRLVAVVAEEGGSPAHRNVRSTPLGSIGSRVEAWRLEHRAADSVEGRVSRRSGRRSSVTEEEALLAFDWACLLCVEGW